MAKFLFKGETIEGLGIAAENTTYSNNNSTLSADNVQDAITELDNKSNNYRDVSANNYRLYPYKSNSTLSASSSGERVRVLRFHPNSTGDPATYDESAMFRIESSESSSAGGTRIGVINFKTRGRYLLITSLEAPETYTGKYTYRWERRKINPNKAIDDADRYLGDWTTWKNLFIGSGVFRSSGAHVVNGYATIGENINPTITEAYEYRLALAVPQGIAVPNAEYFTCNLEVIKLLGNNEY